MAAAGNRVRVNVFLAVFLPALAIDAFHPIGDSHAELDRQLNHVLAPLGLWQGPWRLYGPDVDKVNLRLSAEVHFTDQTVATWDSPEWTEISALKKFFRARHMNYWANILKADEEPAWDALSAYLARTVPHPPGGSA